MAELQLLIEKDKAVTESEEKRRDEFSNVDASLSRKTIYFILGAENSVRGSIRKEEKAYSKLNLRCPLVIHSNGRNSNRKFGELP
nr:hypothetical protein [Tanacetum cinerariifolium]